VSRKPTDEDRRLFEEAMKGVRPLERKTGRAIAVVPPAGAPKITPAKAAPAALVAVRREGEHYLLLAPGLDRARMRAMLASPPQGQLDLHGHDGTRARGTLRAFLDRARAQGWQRVLIIHGRGHRSGPDGPVLRDRVLDTLLAADGVLAVVNAPPALGGLGAALVLLSARAAGSRWPKE
jgi:DNA-nicking Smr family endonuclease